MLAVHTNLTRRCQICCFTLQNLNVELLNWLTAFKITLMQSVGTWTSNRSSCSAAVPQVAPQQGDFVQVALPLSVPFPRHTKCYVNGDGPGAEREPLWWTSKTMHLMCLFTRVTDRHWEAAASWHLTAGFSGLALTTNCSEQHHSGTARRELDLLKVRRLHQQ